MRIYTNNWLMAGLAKELKRCAGLGVWTGNSHTKYFQRCGAFHQPTGTRMIFTRDTGHHTSGWWKNPDYERCYHLSLSFVDPETLEVSSRNLNLTKQWLELFFGDNRKLLWTEPPYSEEGKKNGVWHYRLFCDEFWQPLLPRKEVYTKEYTPAGWKSWSDMQAELSNVDI